jgi:CheY-like chemotaxis protein
VGFRLRLPRAPRRTVLLIDDNLDILELYQRYLQQRHYHAVTVQGGAEALRLASQLQPQANVLDLMMPEQDGWEILQWLTNHPDTHKIPVVICSILRARQLAMALGAAAFLEKPVDEMEFLGVLDTLTAR